MLEIAKKALAEVCREVFHSEVGFEEEAEAHCINILQTEMKFIIARLQKSKVKAFMPRGPQLLDNFKILQEFFYEKSMRVKDAN